MRCAVTLLCLFLAAPLAAQVDLVRESYFPAALEFKELERILSDLPGGSDPDLRGVAEAALFREAGIRSYRRRAYATTGGPRLTIETAEFKDGKAPYSLLSLLRAGALDKGAPGDFHASTGDGIVFAQGKVLVRVTGEAELGRRVATSVSNRIPAHEAAPLLLGRLPGQGEDRASARYFLGPAALERYATSRAVRRLRLPSDVEVAEAGYAAEGRSGTLALVSFATSQLAEEYYDRLFAGAARPAAQPAPGGLFFRRVGPIVGV